MQYEELVRKYGEDNAKYVIETMGDGTPHYDTLGFISMGLDCEGPFRERAMREAKEKGWTFLEIKGSMSLLAKLINGNWDDDFFVLNAGEKAAASYDDKVLKCDACKEI